MFTAKLIRHRWQDETTRSLNGRLDAHVISHEDHFKVVFSAPEEMEKFMKWCEENGGEYDWDRANNKQEGELPEAAKKLFPEDVGWCDLITYYLLHVAGYSFHSVIADVAFKGEVYTKEERPPMGGWCKDFNTEVIRATEEQKEKIIEEFKNQIAKTKDSNP